MASPVQLFNPEAHGPKTSHLPKKLSTEQVERLLLRARWEVEEARTVIKRKAALDDEVIVHLGLYMGLRVSEMAALMVERFNFADRELFVHEGKGKKDRLVPIPAKLVDFFQERIGARKEGPMFYTRKGQMTDSGIQWRVDRLGKLCGFPFRLHPHMFRHTFATNVLKATGNLRVVQQLLGHNDIATTAIYLHLETSEMKKAVDLL